MSKNKKPEDPIEGELDAEELSKVSGGLGFLRPLIPLVPLFNPLNLQGTASTAESGAGALSMDSAQHAGTGS